MKPLLIFVFLYSSLVLSNELKPSKLLGHNLSITSNVLNAGECTFGFLHAGCGLTDKLTIGSSPWMAISYNMAAVAFRYELSNDDSKTEMIQFSYLKTNNNRKPFDDNDDFMDGLYMGYQMESAWLIYVRTHKLNSHFRVHYNFHFNYYFDELAPFSIRRPYIDANPWQINTTALLEADLYKGWFMQGEFGLIDLINSPIHSHIGATLGWRWDGGYVSFGFSQTSTLKALFSPDERFDYGYELIRNEREGYNSELDPKKVENDYSIHAELNLQFFF